MNTFPDLSTTVWDTSSDPKATASDTRCEACEAPTISDLNATEWATRREAREALHVSDQTVARYIRQGLLLAVKTHPSRRVLVRRDTIADLLALARVVSGKP